MFSSYCLPFFVFGNLIILKWNIRITATSTITQNKATLEPTIMFLVSPLICFDDSGAFSVGDFLVTVGFFVADCVVFFSVSFVGENVAILGVCFVRFGVVRVASCCVVCARVEAVGDKIVWFWGKANDVYVSDNVVVSCRAVVETVVVKGTLDVITEGMMVLIMVDVNIVDLVNSGGAVVSFVDLVVVIDAIVGDVIVFRVEDIVVVDGFCSDVGVKVSDINVDSCADVVIGRVITVVDGFGVTVVAAVAILVVWPVGKSAPGMWSWIRFKFSSENIIINYSIIDIT